MPLVKKVGKHGNSQGIILDQPVLKQVGWQTGTEVEVKIEGDSIVLTRHVYASDEAVRASASRMLERHRKSFEKLAE